MRKIKNYKDFWPYYLREHSSPATRGWHYVGTAIGLLILIYIIFTGALKFLPLVFVSGYFFAWMSHATIEKNKPATFTYPLWSLISDFRMFYCFLSGKMTAELNKAGLDR
jgi:hypothetical protein